MALSTTCKKMSQLLEEISSDLAKAVGGNKAAAQRVRVHTVALEKVAKLYRKESVADEKKGGRKAKKKSRCVLWCTDVLSIDVSVNLEGGKVSLALQWMKISLERQYLTSWKTAARFRSH